MKTKIKHIVSTKGTDWKPFEGEELPERIFNMIQASNGFQSLGACWCIGAVFYKGDIDTTNDWIVTTDDGGYYKVGASFMMWHLSPDGKCFHGLAAWSGAFLKKAIKSYITTGKCFRDPDYQS